MKFDDARSKIERFYQEEFGFVPEIFILGDEYGCFTMLESVNGEAAVFQFFRICPDCGKSESGSNYLQTDGYVEFYGSALPDSELFRCCAE